jgi:predicted nucleic acid-binding protein
MTTLAEFVGQLPPDIQREVKDFAEFLLKKRAERRYEVPAFDWEGDLKDNAERYTSVELQHHILRLRGEWCISWIPISSLRSCSSETKARLLRTYLATIPSTKLFMTDFSLHSIGVFLFQRNKRETYERFVQDIIVRTMVAVIGLDPEDLFLLTKVSKQFYLDFDDAYQYAVAEKHGLQIMSFDADFDRTEKGRKVPDLAPWIAEWARRPEDWRFREIIAAIAISPDEMLKEAGIFRPAAHAEGRSGSSLFLVGVRDV